MFGTDLNYLGSSPCVKLFEGQHLWAGNCGCTQLALWVLESSYLFCLSTVLYLQSNHLSVVLFHTMEQWDPPFLPHSLTRYLSFLAPTSLPTYLPPSLPTYLPPTYLPTSLSISLPPFLRPLYCKQEVSSFSSYLQALEFFSLFSLSFYFFVNISFQFILFPVPSTNSYLDSTPFWLFYF